MTAAKKRRIKVGDRVSFETYLPGQRKLAPEKRRTVTTTGTVYGTYLAADSWVVVGDDREVFDMGSKSESSLTLLPSEDAS